MAINNFFDELTPEQEEMLQLSRQAPMPDGTVFPEQDIMMPEGGMSVDPNMAQPSPLDTILADTRSPMSEMTPDQMMSTPSQSDMDLEEMNLNKVPEINEKNETFADIFRDRQGNVTRDYLRGELRGKIYERIKGYNPAQMEADKAKELESAEPGIGREIASVVGSALMGGAGKVAFADLDEQTRKKKLDIEKKYNLKAGQFEKDVEMMGQLDQNELKSALMTAELSEKELKSKINAQIYSDAQAARDPNSPQSKFAQQIINDGLGIRTNLPASQLTAQVNDASDAIKLKSVLALKNQSAERLQQLKTGQAQQAVLGKEARDIQKEERKSVTPLGVALSPQDAKEVKEGIEAKKSFDSKVQQLIDLRKEYGSELLDRDAIARGRQLSKQLLLDIKNMAKLGVLSKSDEDIINQIVPEDPLAVSPSRLVGQDPVMTQLEGLKKDTDERYQTMLRTRLKNPEAAIQQSTQSDIKTKMIDGKPVQFKKTQRGWEPI